MYSLQTVVLYSFHPFGYISAGISAGCTEDIDRCIAYTSCMGAKLYDPPLSTNRLIYAPAMMTCTSFIFSLCVIFGLFCCAIWPSAQFCDVVGLFGQLCLKWSKSPYATHLILNMSHGLYGIFNYVFAFAFPNSMGADPVLLDAGAWYIPLLSG